MVRESLYRYLEDVDDGIYRTLLECELLTCQQVRYLVADVFGYTSVSQLVVKACTCDRTDPTIWFTDADEGGLGEEVLDNGGCVVVDDHVGKGCEPRDEIPLVFLLPKLGLGKRRDIFSLGAMGSSMGPFLDHTQ